MQVYLSKVRLGNPLLCFKL